MVIISKRPRWLAPIFTIVGFFLLIAAHLLSGLLPQGYFKTINTINFVTWIVFVELLTLYYLHYGFSSKIIKRFLLVVSIFALGMFPLESDNVDVTAASLSMIGIILFIYGATMWTGIHTLFAGFGRIIALHRSVTAPSYLAIIYAAFLIITLSLSWHCFHFIPSYEDSIAQYVHGKFFAKAQLYGNTPSLHEFFPVWMMINNGKWYAQYQPLHEIMLGLGHLAGAPWLINPLEGALTVVLIYLLTRRIFDEATARLAGLISLTCTFMLFMSSEFMNHTTSLLFTTLMAYCYVEMLEALPVCRKTTYWWALAAGLSIGAVFLTRPLDAVGVGLPFVIYAAILLKQEFRLYLKPCLIMAVASFVCLMLALWFNQQVTGDALLFPTGAYHGGHNITAMGYYGPVSIQYILSKTQNEWVRLNRQMFELWLPSTFFLMIFCFLPIKNRYANLLLCMIVSHTIFNMANQYNSGVFGPRYLYETVSAIIILSAAGITRIPLLLRTSGIYLPKSPALQGIIASTLVLTLVSSWTYNLLPLINEYSHFFDNHPEFYNSMLRQSKKPALIFIGHGEDPTIKYGWVSFTNPPSEGAAVIFAIDRGFTEDRKLIVRNPGRYAYMELGGGLIPFDAIESREYPDSNKKP